MNKVILMGRLTNDPEVRYTQSETPTAITKYTLAVNRKFKREGEPTADFINCICFGKTAEFTEKYFKKGLQVAVSGRLSVRSYDDANGQKKWITEVVVEDQYFADSKKDDNTNQNLSPKSNKPNPPIDDVDDDDLPF